MTDKLKLKLNDKIVEITIDNNGRHNKVMYRLLDLEERK